MKNPTPKPIEELVESFNYPIVEKTTLIRPGDNEQIDFFKAVLSRRSSRTYKPLDIDVMSKILWYSSKVANVSLTQDAYILSQRPAPSAGSRHPIDILLSPADDLTDRSLYYYNPFDHSINKLQLNSKIVMDFFIQVNEIINCKSATIVWFIAHPSRTESKYENAESLIWRDAGALLYCFQLVCTALKVQSCALGTLGEPFVSQIFEDYGKVYGVGGVLAG